MTIHALWLNLYDTLPLSFSLNHTDMARRCKSRTKSLRKNNDFWDINHFILE